MGVLKQEQRFGGLTFANFASDVLLQLPAFFVTYPPEVQNAQGRNRGLARQTTHFTC
jgi:hypothetical protein